MAAEVDNHKGAQRTMSRPCFFFTDNFPNSPCQLRKTTIGATSIPSTHLLENDVLQQLVEAAFQGPSGK